MGLGTYVLQYGHWECLRGSCRWERPVYGRYDHDVPFVMRKLQPMFGHALESSTGVVSRREVMDFITWDNMVAYWNATGGH